MLFDTTITALIMVTEQTMHPYSSCNVQKSPSSPIAQENQIFESPPPCYSFHLLLPIPILHLPPPPPFYNPPPPANNRHSLSHSAKTLGYERQNAH